MILFNKNPTTFVTLNGKHYFVADKLQPRDSIYNKLVKNLEDFPECQFGIVPLSYGLDDRLLPAVGSTIPVQYSIDAGERPSESPILTVMTEW